MAIEKNIQLWKKVGQTLHYKLQTLQTVNITDQKYIRMQFHLAYKRECTPVMIYTHIHIYIHTVYDNGLLVSTRNQCGQKAKPYIK